MTFLKSMSESKLKNSKVHILVCSAHSDDFVLGAGGTIKKYINEKKKVSSIIFSYGEKSHPWLKEKEVQKMRSQEAFDAAETLGCKAEFFDLQEGKFIEEAEEKNSVKKIIEIIRKEKINKIFTHSAEDPHPDHRAVHKLTLKALKSLEKSEMPEVYVYSVWNPVEFKTGFPALYVDVSSTFKDKIQALKKFPSQKLAIFTLSFIVFFRALKHGFKIKKRFAEMFYRIK